ncbi:MAG: hypothetical protein [Olavius algarvensis Delta 4 endosymbiont]|nr:MAG: hypothetical protein [Olavius algarvensis Delta 4 endosymbiont]
MKTCERTPDGRTHESLACGNKTEMSGVRDQVSEGRVTYWFCISVVIPAKAGIQMRRWRRRSVGKGYREKKG